MSVAAQLVEHLKTKLHDPREFRNFYRDATDDQRRQVFQELKALNALHPVDERRRKLMTASELIDSVRSRIQRDS